MGRETQRRMETDSVHAGEPRPGIGGAVVPPIFQSSTFEYAGEASYHDVRYIRLNNTPNHSILHEKLARLEGAEASLVTASGMAAITSALLTVVKQGDHLLAHRVLYGGTHTFCTDELPRMGVEVDFVDAERPETWEAKLKKNTRGIYVETITNPLMQVADLPAVVAFAKRNNIVSMIDATFGSPVVYRPIEHGFDLSLQSATKYLNGHNDIVAGVVSGPREMIERIKHRLDHLGGSLDPHACYLLNRGLKTLVLRVRQQCATALALATALAEHPAVARVNYPGLPTHPNHARARELFGGLYGGMLSFELNGNVERTDRFMDALTIPVVAPSLGGVETLITRPATTSAAGMTPEDRAAVGITDTLVRVSVGVESADDLIADFRQALGL